MRTIFAIFLYLSSLPWHETSSNVFEVHEFLFMNKSILYLWKRRTPPKAGRFCLCYGSSQIMASHFGIFNCTLRRKGSLCRRDHSHPGLAQPLMGCLAKFQTAQTSMHQLPVGLQTDHKKMSAVECKAVDNTTADVLGDFPGNTNITFCSTVLCQQCLGGFSNLSYCTSLWTRDPFLHFEGITQSDFMVGAKWNAHNAGDQNLLMRVCASEGNCYIRCFEERVQGKEGSYLVPTDLWRFRVTLYIHRTDGTTLYQKNFRSKRLAPDRPCFSTSMVKSWSEVRLFWWPHDESSDGYLVSWCEDTTVRMWPFGLVLQRNLPEEKCSTDASGSSVSLRHLQPFSKYVFSVRAYRWIDANHTERLFSRPLRAHPLVLINPTFIPVFVLLAIPAISILISLILILTNLSFRRELPRRPGPLRPDVPDAERQRRVTYQRPPQLPPVVLRRHSRGDF